jgi:hypothetical protein
MCITPAPEPQHTSITELGAWGRCRAALCKKDTKRYVSGPKKTESDEAGKEEWI